MEPAEPNRTAIGLILALSAAAFATLIWLIYFKESAETNAPFVERLPAVNALLNSLSAACLVAGFAAIKRRKQAVHKRFMLAAFGFSTLFLMTYVVYHHFHGDTPFTGTGFVRPVYFFILISHILLTVAALPLILITFYFGLTGRFASHRRVAPITLPLWLYVSVTGVLIYLMLKYFG